MTSVIVARWYDITDVDSGIEIYDVNTNTETLFEHLAACKSVFDHTVQSKGISYIMFSDGSRVELTIAPVQELADDRTITIRKRRELSSS